jgi:asparaginyl-tRNA synthetase
MKILNLKDVYENIENYLDKEISLEGWIRNHRKQKEFGFIEFYDGTAFKNIQLVYDNKLEDFDEITKLHIGSSIKVEGKIVKSLGKGQDYEIVVSKIKLEGDCPEDYPLQPKKHTREFLREIAYLRPRANLFQAVFRIRSLAAMAIHTYFQERGYVYLHAPLITGSDCEGAGEMFQVTTLDLNKIPKNANGEIDYKKDFFGKPSSLTVSGQLQGEIFAMAFKKVYTFGPTFRAENSNTKTHASEFWMIEPEIAFCNLDQVMDVEEDMLRYIINYVIEHAKDEMAFLDRFVEKGLIEKLKVVLNNKPVRITHKEAIDILMKADEKFEYEPKQGEDLAKEHEKYLTEKYFKAPVFVTDWPKDIKAFYMRLNDDQETVAAVDMLVPGAGELMGGSQREERIDILEKRMKELNVGTKDLDWYLNLRKYGGCKHSGFGMGFERLLIYLTGVENIRDVIPFPRTPNNLDF